MYFKPEDLKNSIDQRRQEEYIKKFFSAKKWHFQSDENSVVLMMNGFGSIQYNLSTKIQSPALTLLIESLGGSLEVDIHLMFLSLYREIIEAGIEKVSR